MLAVSSYWLLMTDCWVVVVYVLDVIAAAVIWAWINVHPAIKSNLRHLIEPASPNRDVALAGGSIAIISPGRNEADHLPRTLTAMCEQDDDDYRVIFVDDDSTDDTPTITERLAARYPHLHVLRLSGDPPIGWSGKCRALDRGQTHPAARSAAWLVFADADIDWTPSVLRAARRVAAEHDADLVALFPRLEFGSACEAIVQLQMILALGIFIPMQRAMDPQSPHALTSGAFMMIRRRSYDAAGGHAAIADELIDDLALGRRLKQTGARVRVGFAPKLLSCRMYQGFADQWEGLTKNAYAGVGNRWWVALGLATATMLVNVLPPVYAIIAAVWFAMSPGLLSGATLGLALLAVLLQARALDAVRKLANLSAGYAWTLPIGSAIYIVILLASMGRHHTGGARWKGRRYRRPDDAPR